MVSNSPSLCVRCGLRHVGPGSGRPLRAVRVGAPEAGGDRGYVEAHDENVDKIAPRARRLGPRRWCQSPSPQPREGDTQS